MTSPAPADKTQASSKQAKLINGRHVAPTLLPSVSYGTLAPLLRLYLDHYKGPEGSPLKVKILEVDGYTTMDGNGRKKRISEGGGDVVLATFTAVPVTASSKTTRPYWKDVKAGDAALEKPPAKHVPYFRLSFAGGDTKKSGGAQEPEAGCPVFHIPLDKAGEEEDGFEIAYQIEDSAGNVQAALDTNVVKLHIPFCHIPRAHASALLCADLSLRVPSEARLAEMYRSKQADLLESPTWKQVERNQARRMQEAAERAVEELRVYLEKNEGVYAAHLRNYRAFYELLAEYQKLTKVWGEETDSGRLSIENRLGYLRVEIEKRKADLDAYLEKNQSIPKAYLDEVKKLREDREKGKAIEAFLDTPIGKALTVMPYSGFATATLKVIQGDYKGAFVDAGMELVAFGSFKKLKAMAELYDAVGSSMKSGKGAMVKLLLTRYLTASSGQFKKFESLGSIVAKADPGFSALFSTVKSTNGLKKKGVEIWELYKGRKSLREAADILRKSEFSSAVDLVEALKRSTAINGLLIAANTIKAISEGKSVGKNIIKLVDHEVKTPEKRPEEKVAEVISEIRAIGRHSNILPTLEESLDAANALEEFVGALDFRKITLEEVLLEFDPNEIRARVAAEKTTMDWRPAWFEKIKQTNLNHSKAQLIRELEELEREFHQIVPVRQRLVRSKGIHTFPFWGGNELKLDQVLETRLDKFIGQLQGRLEIQGVQIEIRSWFFDGAYEDFRGKFWIVEVGHSGLGFNSCREAIEAVSWE